MITPDLSKPEWRAQKTFDQNRKDSVIKAMRPELTEEEKTRPFAKYYFDEIPQPDPAHCALMETPIDPSEAFYPEDINRLLDVDWLRQSTEIGWCILPNGAGYICNSILYPESTAEMIDWWFAWHPLEDLRYRIWYPPQHAGIMVSPIDRARILDPAVPMKEKNWGVVHYVTANCDCGFENIDVDFRSPADMGFDMAKFDTVPATFAGGMGWAVTVQKCDDSITVPALMVHVFYNEEGGLRHRSRFWMGYRLNELNKPELCLPPHVALPEAAVQGLARHNVKEYTRWREFLPRIYKELGGSLYC